MCKQTIVCKAANRALEPMKPKATFEISSEVVSRVIESSWLVDRPAPGH
jgi:hypothetical protein